MAVRNLRRNIGGSMSHSRDGSGTAASRHPGLYVVTNLVLFGVLAVLTYALTRFA